MGNISSFFSWLSTKAAVPSQLSDSDLSAIYTRALKSEGNVVSVPEPGPTPLASLWLVAEDDELVTTVFSVKCKGLPVAPVDTCEFLAHARSDVMMLCLEVAALRKQARVGLPDERTEKPALATDRTR